MRKRRGRDRPAWSFARIGGVAPCRFGASSRPPFSRNEAVRLLMPWVYGRSFARPRPATLEPGRHGRVAAMATDAAAWRSEAYPGWALTLRDFTQPK